MAICLKSVSMMDFIDSEQLDGVDLRMGFAILRQFCEFATIRVAIKKDRA